VKKERRSEWQNQGGGLSAHFEKGDGGMEGEMFCWWLNGGGGNHRKFVLSPSLLEFEENNHNYNNCCI